MILKLKTAPIDEPVTLDEVKTHCRLDDVDLRSTLDDLTLGSLIKVARQYVEEMCGPLMEQTWEQYEDAWPDGSRLAIGKPRVGVVSSVIYTDEDEVETTLSSSDYSVDTVNEYHPAVVLKPDYSWPSVTLFNANPIKITFACGYGTSIEDVPEPLRHALLLLISHLYEERQPVLVSPTSAQVLPIPMGFDALIANYRVWGF